MGVEFGTPQGYCILVPAQLSRNFKKKATHLQQVNLSVLKQLKSELVEVDIYLVEPPKEKNKVFSEIDEMWSYVEKKSNRRWLWHAIDHQTRLVLAYVFGQRKDEVFLELKKLLQPFGISRFYTDNWGAYSRHLKKQKHIVGKQNTQRRRAIFIGGDETGNAVK